MFPAQQYEKNFSSLNLYIHKTPSSTHSKCTSNNQHLITLAHVQKILTASGMQATHTEVFPTKQNHSTTKAFCILPSMRNSDNTRCNTDYATQTTTWLSVKRGLLPAFLPTCIHLTVSLSYYVALDSLRSLAGSLAQSVGRSVASPVTSLPSRPLRLKQQQTKFA